MKTSDQMSELLEVIKNVKNVYYEKARGLDPFIVEEGKGFARKLDLVAEALIDRADISRELITIAAFDLLITKLTENEAFYLLEND